MNPDIAIEATPVRRGFVFATVALALLMMSVDSTIVATILHTLQSDMDTTVNWAGWTLTAYGFGFVVMLPVSGRLAEHFGQRRVFIASVVVFTTASLLCGLTDNIVVLIALRALQAAGGAGFTPSATAIVVNNFGPARDRAVGLFGSIFPIGAMIGPILGGLFVSYWSWRAAFLVNGPIGLAVIALALRYIPPDPLRERGVMNMDIAGMALLGCGLLAGMAGIGGLGEARTAMALSISGGLLALTGLCGVWFFRHIGRSSRPFIAPRFIYGPSFGAVNLVNMIYSGVPIGAAALIPLYAANRYQIGAFEAGSLLVAQGIATVIFSGASVALLRRIGYRWPIYIGGSIIAIGLLVMAIEPIAGISAYAWLSAAAALVGTGSGLLNPATRNAGLQLAPEQSAMLAALRSLAFQLGTISTISITTAIVASSTTPGVMQAWAYGAVAIVLMAALPIVARVPEHRGSW